MDPKSLVITGAMGAGKTSVLGEASDILALENITHAAIDLDALGLAYLPSGRSTSKSDNDVVMYRNLRSVCKNYASVGVRRFIVARAAAVAAGCEYAVVVTQGGTTSQRNAERLGFRVAYSKVTVIKNLKWFLNRVRLGR